MTEVSRTARPDVLVTGGQGLDGPLGSLVAYLDALKARLAALERRLSAVPLMTAADAARYARVNVETILRAVRAGEIPVAGHIGRSPRISRDALHGWLATKAQSAPPDCSAAPPAKGKRCRRGGTAGAGVNVARQLGHGGRLPRRHVSPRAGRARPRTEVAAVDAILQARSGPASDASGFDRIVGVMFAPRSYDALPSKRGRGATMGPSGCSDPSPPVAFRRRRCHGLQGLTASWDDWRRQKVVLIRKRSQVRVLDRPSTGIQEFPAFAQLPGIWLRVGPCGWGVPRGHMGPPRFT